ncbi:uncharacterized protein LOC112532533 [Gallus gallus]|uniref:uncharacterized protein LOC112532533 n=1 Tax=Gallus gallus TaxID=9031 RepID=UPI001AE92C4F|nr:uncharacterized protein LOC112532533 [Gallus gallus]
MFLQKRTLCHSYEDDHPAQFLSILVAAVDVWGKHTITGHIWRDPFPGLDLDQCWAFRQFIAHILCLSGQDKPWLPLCTSPTMQLLFDREEMWEYGKSFNIQYFALWIVVFQVTRGKGMGVFSRNSEEKKNMN